MTREEFQSLDLIYPYRFDLYWGEKKYGYLTENEGKYYISTGELRDIFPLSEKVHERIIGENKSQVG